MAWYAGGLSHKVQCRAPAIRALSTDWYRHRKRRRFYYSGARCRAAAAQPSTPGNRRLEAHARGMQQANAWRFSICPESALNLPSICPGVPQSALNLSSICLQSAPASLNLPLNPPRNLPRRPSLSLPSSLSLPPSSPFLSQLQRTFFLVASWSGEASMRC